MLADGPIEGLTEYGRPYDRKRGFQKIPLVSAPGLLCGPGGLREGGKKTQALRKVQTDLSAASLEFFL
jgi:hypothetical protein